MTEYDKKATPKSGPWQKGRSGDPAGRRKGRRNKATLAMEALLEGSVEQLIAKAVGMALKGDVAAMRLCLERILPARKDRLICLDLPPIETGGHISGAVSAILTAISEGQLTPGEGEMMINILSVKTKILAGEDWERRVEKVEKTIAQFQADEQSVN
jgi:hypothetical protein